MKMRVLIPLLLLLAACGNETSHPDVGQIPATITLRRFDKAMAEADTGNMPAMVDKLRSAYPDFFDSYMSSVLGIASNDPEAYRALKAFQSSYKPVFADADAIMQSHGAKLLTDLKLALQLAKYYCPEKKLPEPFELISFVGPMDAYEPFAIGDYGDVSTANGGGLALQFYLGKNSGVYEAGLESGVMYDYQVNRFEPDLMVVNTAKNIVLSLYPYGAKGDALVHEMIEKGKRMYLLKRILPDTPDSLQMGYSAKEWEGCITNEALIWNFFVKADLLYSKEPQVNQFYIQDGPMTQELGEGAPGYIGLFLGRRLVEAYMEKNPDLGIEALMATSAATLFQQSGYNPK